MNYKEKILRERQLIKNWEKISDSKNDLSDILLFKRKLESIDIMNIYQ